MNTKKAITDFSSTNHGQSESNIQASVAQDHLGADSDSTKKLSHRIFANRLHGSSCWPDRIGMKKSAAVSAWKFYLAELNRLLERFDEMVGRYLLSVRQNRVLRLT